MVQKNFDYCGEELIYTVYAHVNKTNGKTYVGMSKNIKNRWNINKYNNCPIFYSALLKYGWDGFNHIILFEKLTKTMACEIEKMLISKFNLQDRMFGYNIRDGGLYAYNKNKRTNNAKYVYQYYRETGEFIKRWDSASQAKKETGDNVSMIASGKIKNITGDYIWKYEYFDKVNPLPKYHSGDHNIKRTNVIYVFDKMKNKVGQYNDIREITYNSSEINIIKQVLDKNDRHLSYKGLFYIYESDYNNNYLDYIINKHNNFFNEINQFDYDNNLINHYNSEKEASLKTGVEAKQISQCCHLLKNTAGGFQWRFASDPYPGKYIPKKSDGRSKKVVQKDMDNNIINIFPSATQAGKSIGKYHSSILDCCYGRIQSAYGYLWEFSDEEGDVMDE